MTPKDKGLDTHQLKTPDYRLMIGHHAAYPQVTRCKLSSLFLQRFAQVQGRQGCMGRYLEPKIAPTPERGVFLR
jgi:hypothetical protein